MTETYYELLDVDPDADRDEVRKAYKRKLSEYHPDVSSLPDDEAKERFYRIKEASILTDPDERARYDRLGHDAYVGEDGSSTSGSGSREQSSERDSKSSSTGSDSSGRQRTGTGGDDGRSRSSAASEYRNRRRRTRSRSRSDSRTDTNSWSQATSEGRQRSSRRRRNGNASGTGDASNRDGTAETTDSEETSEDDESSSSTENSTKRGPGQPAANGMFVSPDIELLRFPATAALYFFGFEFGYSLLLSLALLPTYLHYRRHRFTEHFLTDAVLSDTEVTSASKRLFFGAAAALASTIGFGASVFAASGGTTLGAVSTLGFVRALSPIGLAFGVAAVVGALVAVRYLSELLLFDWYEAQGTDRPIAVEVLCRAPLLVLPFVLAEPAAFVAPAAVVTALLAVSAVGPLVYFAWTGKQTGVEFVDRAVA